MQAQKYFSDQHPWMPGEHGQSPGTQSRLFACTPGFHSRPKCSVCLSKPSAPEHHPNLLVLLVLAASSPCQLSRPPSSLPSCGQCFLGPPGGWKWPCPAVHPCIHQFPRMSPWAPPGSYPVLVSTEVSSLGLHLVQIIHGLFHSFHQFLLSTYDATKQLNWTCKSVWLVSRKTAVFFCPLCLLLWCGQPELQTR